jgi:DNA-binding LacI/PurR family transcriptional regulator
VTKPSARQERILAILRSRGPARVAELAREFDVSPITLRRDVEALARDEQVVRGHGVVRLPSTRRPGRSQRPTADAVVLMAPLHNTYLGQILTGARESAEQQGLRCVLLGVEEKEPMSSAMRRAAAVPGALGALVIPRWRSVTTVEAEEMASAEDGTPLVPTVLLERFPPVDSALAELDAVRTDHTRGVLLALRHLRERGHTRILLAARDDSPTARTIRQAFLRLVPELGLPLLAEPLLSAPGAAPDPATPMPYLPAAIRETGATALVAHSDVDALNLVTQLHAAGIRVPDDLSIVAYDDMISNLGGPELTVVAPPKREVGREALVMLQDRVERGGPTRHVELLPALVDRRSVRTIDQF